MVQFRSSELDRCDLVVAVCEALRDQFRGRLIFREEDNRDELGGSSFDTGVEYTMVNVEYCSEK